MAVAAAESAQARLFRGQARWAPPVDVLWSCRSAFSAVSTVSAAGAIRAHRFAIVPLRAAVWRVHFAVPCRAVDVLCRVPSLVPIAPPAGAGGRATHHHRSARRTAPCSRCEAVDCRLRAIPEPPLLALRRELVVIRRSRPAFASTSTLDALALPRCFRRLLLSAALTTTGDGSLDQVARRHAVGHHFGTHGTHHQGTHCRCGDHPEVTATAPNGMTRN